MTKLLSILNVKNKGLPEMICHMFCHSNISPVRLLYTWKINLCLLFFNLKLNYLYATKTYWICQFWTNRNKQTIHCRHRLSTNVIQLTVVVFSRWTLYICDRNVRLLWFMCFVVSIPYCLQMAQKANYSWPTLMRKFNAVFFADSLYLLDPGVS